MKIYILYVFLFFIVTVATVDTFAQDTLSLIGEVDLVDLLRSKKKQAEVKMQDSSPKKGKMMIFAVPAIGSNPSMGSFFGLAGTGAVYLGEPANTNISSLSASALVTTKNQLLVNLKGTIMTPRNGWEFLLDTRYLIYSEDTYGLGTDKLQPVKSGWNLGGINTSSIPGAQPMEFDHIRVHFTALRQLQDFLYVGVGYHLDYHYDIKDVLLDLESDTLTVTSHYAYNRYYGFPTDAYTTSGISLNVALDSRDHTVSPYKGQFLQFAYRINSTRLGSSQDNQFVYLEVRKYFPLSKLIPRHLLGVWGIAQINVQGKLPYFDLPASGYDMRNRIGKGYVSGRFRGEDWITLETEWRFPITNNGLLGGVLFASATSTSRPQTAVLGYSTPGLKLLETVRPAGGFGIRLQLNKSGRMNVTMDMAFGQEGSKGFYFAVGETF